MLTRESVMEAVKGVAASDWGVDPSGLDGGSELAQLADSANQLATAAKLENQLGVQFMDENAVPAQTIDQLVDQIMAKAG